MIIKRIHLKLATTTLVFLGPNTVSGHNSPRPLDMGASGHFLNWDVKVQVYDLGGDGSDDGGMVLPRLGPGAGATERHVG